jgi:hypothetical protein
MQQTLPDCQHPVSGFDQTSYANAGLTRVIHETSTAAADPGMSTSLRSVGFLDVLVEA